MKRFIMKKNRTAIFIVLIWLFLPSQLSAQGGIIEVTKLSNREEVVNFDEEFGISEVVFVSKYKDLIIRTSRPSLDTLIISNKKNKDGEYEYVVRMIVYNKKQEIYAWDRVLAISKKNEVNEVEIKDYFDGNRRVFYRVDYYLNRIILEEKNDDVVLDRGKAVVELRSSFPLLVRMQDSSLCKFVIKNIKNSRDIYVNTIEIDCAKLKSLQDNVNELKHELQKYGSRNNYERIGRLEKDIESAEEKYNNATVVYVWEKEANSNCLEVPIWDIKPRTKKIYNILGGEGITNQYKKSAMRRKNESGKLAELEPGEEFRRSGASDHFIEFGAAFGGDSYLATVSYTYLPNRLGIYGTLGVSFEMVSVFAGSSLRLTSRRSEGVDIQLYAGVGGYYGYVPGFALNAGARIGWPIAFFSEKRQSVCPQSISGGILLFSPHAEDNTLVANDVMVNLGVSWETSLGVLGIGLIVGLVSLGI